MFYDAGTTGTPNNEWWKSSGLTLISDGTGLTASNSSSSSQYLSPNKIGTPKSQMSDLIDWNDFICEFTFHEISNSNTITFETRDSNSQVNQRSLNGMNLVDGDIVKMVYTDNILKYYKNDVQQGSNQTNCTGNVMIRFSVPNMDFKFSDFKVYSI